LLAVVAAATVLGCAGSRGGSTAAGSTAKSADTLEARLIATGGSAAKGVVRFAPAGSSVSVSIFFSGVSPGDYRMVIHATGNCSSPNGFSAGPPWLASGSAEPIAIGFRVDNDGTVSTSQRRAGLVLDGPQGIAGRAVVIHEGHAGNLDAQPDRANGRVACGVIGPATRLIDLF
jgi:Cu/Zn superoxide dismutase